MRLIEPELQDSLAGTAMPVTRRKAFDLLSFREFRECGGFWRMTDSPALFSEPDLPLL
jgi:hypothetical protein